ncbi:hypothetical protein V1515DRAFT_608961 [Lipomyces mesembrius]
MSYVVVMRREMFFDQKFVSFGFMFSMNFSTQFFGFGLAGTEKMGRLSSERVHNFSTPYSWSRVYCFSHTGALDDQFTSELAGLLLCPKECIVA